MRGAATIMIKYDEHDCGVTITIDERCPDCGSQIVVDHSRKVSGETLVQIPVQCICQGSTIFVMTQNKHHEMKKLVSNNLALSIPSTKGVTVRPSWQRGYREQIGQATIISASYVLERRNHLCKVRLPERAYTSKF